MTPVAPEPAEHLEDRDDMVSLVAGRLEFVERVLATHAGGIRLVEVTGDGAVRLRFTGMCAGCMLRPLTMANVVAPALSDIAGVTRVDAAGTRVSVAAYARMSAAQTRGEP
jgi:Fe-S cluster biogenesis protein NfuA